MKELILYIIRQTDLTGMVNTLHFFHSTSSSIFNKKRTDKSATTASLLFALILSIFITGDSQADTQNNYRFSADDQISITVFGEPDLSLPKVRIATNGTISIPLIGQVRVQGLTAEKIEKEVTRLFANGYLKKPTVTVSIVEYRQFYINGEVKKPGGYSYRDGLTVERAIALAGGFSERASKNKITVAHEENSNKARRVNITTAIRPGDIITVEESFF